MSESCSFELTPLEQASVTRNENLPNLNYTNQDFSSMKARLVQRIKENFPDDFNDFIESDIAIMLLENQAFIF